MPGRPLVLLDVDGVLNAVPVLGRSPAWDDWQTGTARAEGRAFPITWSPSVVSAVRGWLDVADVHWLTTWGHDANASLRELLGLPELPVAGTYDSPAQGAPDFDGPAHASVAPAAPDPLTGRWWKFDVVREVVRRAPDRRLVWVDDDLRAQDEVRAWMRDHASCLLVAPDLTSGLSPDQLRTIEDYLRADAPG